MTRTLAWLLLALAARAETRSTTPRPAADAHHRVSSAGRAQLSDPDLEKAIRARFARSKIGANHFEVRVQGGVATLGGNTDVVQHKGTATRLAKTAGAVSVVNHIQVSQAARQHAAANLQQGRRRAQVKRGAAESDRSQPRQSR